MAIIISYYNLKGCQLTVCFLSLGLCNIDKTTKRLGSLSVELI